MARIDKDATFVGDSRVPAKRIPNISPSYSDYPGKSEPFWPNFLLKEWMVAAVCLVGFLVLTASHPSPLVEKANPNDTSFIPLPDWYFLFLYQLLKYPWAAGNYILIGIIAIPGLAFGGLLLAPWLDSGKERRPFRRPIATSLMMLSLIAIFYLTWSAHDEHVKKHGANQGGSASAAKGDPNFQAADIWAAQTSCMGCHGKNMEGQVGPSLQKIGGQLKADEIANIIKNGKPPGMPGGMFKGSDADFKKLVDYLASLK